MELREAESLARVLMDKHGLVAKGWNFEFDKAARRMGLCNYRRRMISMSRKLTEINKVDEVTDTILHEIAHALAPIGSGHGPAWKHMAASIGARPVRCYSEENVATLTYKWFARCKMCGQCHSKISHRRPWDATCACWQKADIATRSQNWKKYQMVYSKAETIVVQPRAEACNPSPAPVARPAKSMWFDSPRPAAATAATPGTISFDAAKAVEMYRAGTKVVDIAMKFGYPRGSGQNRVRAALIKAAVYKS